MKRSFGLVTALFVLGLVFGCGGEGDADKLCGAFSSCGGDGDNHEAADETPAPCGEEGECAGEGVCMKGVCCAPWQIGACDFPCDYDNEGISVHYTEPGLYCFQNHIYRFETKPCGPCDFGATCQKTLVTSCPAGTACQTSEKSVPACVPVDGDAEADGDSERAYDCTTIGVPTENAACPQEGLRVCTDSRACSLCGGFRCANGRWQKADEIDVSCEAGLGCDCKTYVTDGDEDCADGF